MDFSAHLRAKAKSEDLNASAAPPSLLTFLLCCTLCCFSSIKTCWQLFFMISGWWKDNNDCGEVRPELLSHFICFCKDKETNKQYFHVWMVPCERIHLLSLFKKFCINTFALHTSRDRTVRWPTHTQTHGPYLTTAWSTDAQPENCKYWTTPCLWKMKYNSQRQFILLLLFYELICS